MHSLNDTFEDELDLFETRFINNRQTKQRRFQQKQRNFNRDLAPQHIAEQRIGDDEFVPSFTSSENEQRLLQDALTTFYRERVLTDVLGSVKGGKEASVYCCEAHPSTNVQYLAAKIYRPRMLRNLRNDAPYKEGREAMDEQGKAIRDSRRHRAMLKKTLYGKEVAISSWIEHEYGTLRLLYDAGGDVPEPIMRGNNTILMTYYGEVHNPAPTLNGVRLPPNSARRHYRRMLDNIELMLANNRIHADFSAYNILYWQDELVIIDFPQAVHATSNGHAEFFLHRDVERLCQYFERYGIRSNPQRIAADLWQGFKDGEL